MLLGSIAAFLDMKYLYSSTVALLTVTDPNQLLPVAVIDSLRAFVTSHSPSLSMLPTT